MENILSIGAGVALRVVLDVATGKDHKLVGILIGLWEGVVLSHFLSKHTRSRSRSKDPYLALATRVAIDIYLSQSLSRFALTCAWTLVGLLLADVAPGIWRDSGLKRVYKALRREVRSIMKAMPRWKVKNDFRVPKISIKYPVRSLFRRAPPSSVVSSTRAAPPASPSQQIHKRRMPLGTYLGRPALSETNSELSRVREVVPGPSPAFISTAVDPACLPPVDLHSQHISHLSDAGPSRHDPIIIQDDSWVHVSVSTHSPEQGQDPELSALDIPPLTSESQTITANIEVVSPTPRMHANALPKITAHQVPLPESRPASVMGSVLSLFGAKNILSRVRSDKTTSDVGIDATQHQASTAEWERPISRQGQPQPSPVTGHRRVGSGPGPSMLRHADEDDEDDDGESVVGSVVGKGARTEPIFGGRSESLLGTGTTGGAAFVGGLSAEVIAPEAFVGGFAVEYTRNEFAIQSDIASQNPPVHPSQTPTLPDALTTRSTTTDPKPLDGVHASNTDGITGININTTTDNPLPNSISNADDLGSNHNPALTATQKPGKSERKKRGPKNAIQPSIQNATPGAPETTPQDQQSSARAQTPGPDSQNPAGSASDPVPTPDGLTQDAAVPVQHTTGIDTNTTKHGHIRGMQGPDFPDSSPNSPPPPFKEVATPIEPTLLTPEQTERESLRGEFLMRELKQLEVLIAKAESGTGRGSPSALSVERLNGLKERLEMVRERVERRVYEDPSDELETPHQLTLSGIDGPSAVDLVQTAIVDLLLETPHAEPLAVVGYINKQKKGGGKAGDLKNAVVDWVKENKFKVRNDSGTPFILNITF